MALSSKKKNQIIADHKAGRFTSRNAFAKHYKIHRNTLIKIVDGIGEEHALIVAQGVAYECAKKGAKNVQEVASIEKAVAEKVNTIEIDNKLVTNNRKILQTLQGKITERMGEVEVDEDGKPTGKAKKLETFEIKALTGAVKDIESVANPKDTTTKVDVNNNVIVPTMDDLYKRKKVIDV